MINGIFHSAVTVIDMERTLEFYCLILGGERMFTIEAPKGHPHITSVRFADDTFLEFFYPDSAKPATGNADHHFALSTDDIFATEKLLDAHGVEILSRPKIVRDGNWQLWCRDPNGYRVEIMQIMPGCPQRRRPSVYEILY